MADRSLRLVSIFFASTFAACASPESDNAAIDLTDPNVSPLDRGKAAALTARDAALLAGDLNAFLSSSLGFSTAGLGGRSGPPLPQQLAFTGPVGCTHHGSFGSGGIMLDHDCTMPSGRHTSGSLSIVFGAGCSPFGISIEHHLLVESSPGAGDEVVVDGRTDIGFGGDHLNLSTVLDSHIAGGGHTIDHSIAACLIVERGSLAMNGHVLSSVDGTSHKRVEVQDLQMQFCAGLPHTGTVRVENDRHEIEVVFDRSSPETSVVTVTVDGGTTRAELELSPIGRACAIPPAPMQIDYASCGGCGQPPPPVIPPASSTTNPKGPNL